MLSRSMGWDLVDGSGDPEPIAPFGLIVETGHNGADCRARLSRSIGVDDRHRLEPDFSVGHHRRNLRPGSHAPKPDPPRQMRPAQRPVYDPHAYYPDEKGPEFDA